MEDDPFDSPEWKRYVEHFRHETLPKIESSCVAVALLPTTGEPDIKIMLEVGAMVLLEKPIIVLRKRSGMQVPRRLRQIAEAVIEFDDIRDPDVQRQLKAAFYRAKGRG